MKYPKNANLFMFILMMLFIFIGNGVLPIFFQYIFSFFPNMEIKNQLLILQFVSVIVCFILPIILYIAIKKIPIKELIPMEKLSIKNILILIFLSFSIIPMIQLIAFITNIFYKDKVSDVINIFTSLSLPKALFITALVPAITEELVFRGVILTGYKKSPILIGVLMSSLYFGLIHFTVTQLFYTIAVGVIFALVVKVTKSIYATILMHFILNGTQVIQVYLVREDSTQVAQQVYNIKDILLNLFYYFIYFIISLPFLAFSIYLFIKYNKEKINDLKEENKIIKNDKNRPKAITLFFYINIIVYICYMILAHIAKKML